MNSFVIAKLFVALPENLPIATMKNYGNLYLYQILKYGRFYPFGYVSTSHAYIIVPLPDSFSVPRCTLSPRQRDLQLMGSMPQNQVRWET
jgi:hypothetical protein